MNYAASDALTVCFSQLVEHRMQIQVSRSPFIGIAHKQMSTLVAAKPDAAIRSWDAYQVFRPIAAAAWTARMFR